jgi:hypothetical protein
MRYIDNIFSVYCNVLLNVEHATTKQNPIVTKTSKYIHLQHRLLCHQDVDTLLRWS